MGACIKLSIMKADGLIGPLTGGWSVGVSGTELFQGLSNVNTGEHLRRDPSSSGLTSE
jgi:hypothetical protein